MTIYVDELFEWSGIVPSALPGKWSHLATDGDLEELHLFAEKIGLKRTWLHNHPGLPHYDLTPSKRRKAIIHGAISVTSQELLEKCKKDKT